MTKVSDLHRKWSADPEYRTAYDALEGQFAAVASQLGAPASEAPQLRVIVFRDLAGRFGWRIAAEDGRALAHSAEVYASEEAALEAVGLLRRGLARAAIDAAA